MRGGQPAAKVVRMKPQEPEKASGEEEEKKEDIQEKSRVFYGIREKNTTKSETSKDTTEHEELVPKKKKQSLFAMKKA